MLPARRVLHRRRRRHAAHARRRDVASELAGRSLDRYDTQDNITGGVLIIRALQASADSREQAIAGYYQGIDSVRTKGLYDDTKSYVANVLAIYDRL